MEDFWKSFITVKTYNEIENFFTILKLVKIRYSVYVQPSSTYTSLN